ncbi:GNAT acetyltransferase [Acidaminobacter hydrogenoformans DSM 2784]|uniref:GNAT acetyltransferase n=1 Tax=Acidaminobacter hydrogenoformans DSM 2784 TaxID=1120920 RepID=A0A1G5RRA9_9FIRM|nr:GNAT acetyltransferase [Acidaminobacter hydrogenoformans DSM 2784]
MKELSIEILEASEVSRRGLWSELQSFAQCDPARHYFILLGLLNPEKTFRSVITARDDRGNLLATFLQRSSGNAQLMMSQKLMDGSSPQESLQSFAEAVRRIGFNQLIAAMSYCEAIAPFDLFVSHTVGAEISVMSAETAASKELQKEIICDLEPLMTSDLDEIIALYQRCFHSFTPRPVMEEKLLSGRGHGVVVRKNGQIAACAQSEFETSQHALIVGVATTPELRGRGMASACVAGLVKQLAVPGRDFALQYDNPCAGRIYKRLGFIPVDHVGHYNFRKEQ